MPDFTKAKTQETVRGERPAVVLFPGPARRNSNPSAGRLARIWSVMDLEVKSKAWGQYPPRGPIDSRLPAEQTGGANLLINFGIVIPLYAAGGLGLHPE